LRRGTIRKRGRGRGTIGKEERGRGTMRKRGRESIIQKKLEFF
jgi:hypothetical protein